MNNVDFITVFFLIIIELISQWTVAQQRIPLHYIKETTIRDLHCLKSLQIFALKTR